MTKIFLDRDRHLINIRKEGSKIRLRYNLKRLCMEKKDSDGTWYQVKHQYKFFQGLNFENIVCEEEKFKGMLKKTRSLNPECESVSTFISRLGDALVYENYEKEGIKTECFARRSNTWRYSQSERRILSKPLEFYPKNVIKFFKKYDITVRVALEETFITKKQEMSRFIDILESLDIEESLKESFFYDVSYGGSAYHSFNTLIFEYGYDMKALILYVCNYLVPFENLQIQDSLTDLEDYYRMANSIGRAVKKYPKYLRSMHDIITSNFNAYKKEYNEELFKKIMNPNLEFKDKNFLVLNPSCTKDIISEGTDLNHCVGSYVDKILDGKAYIFFLRKIKDPETSLVTLELRNGKISQAKGSYNRAINEDERKFLEKYSKIKNIPIEL